MNTYQRAYFNLMTQSRENLFFVSEHIASADKWNTGINMFMAIASSSSIGAWVVWQQLSWLWAAVIAGSHVIGAIKAHLPFKRRLSVLYTLRNHLEHHCLDMERDFYPVFKGDLTEQEIHDRIVEYKAKKAAIEQKHLSDIVLPETGRLIKRARHKNRTYFENLCFGD